MDTATIKVDPAFSALTLDIVTNILAMAATPSELGKYLTEEMRELTGARTVIVLQCLHQAGAVDDRIVSINPQRRQGLTESPRFARLVEIAHDLNSTTWWHSGEHSGEAEDIITSLNAGLSISVPLNVGEFREGTILLLDLPERRHIESVINMLEMLSPVVALILRNSFLYTQQENIIADRTRQLQQSEQRYRSLVENVDLGVTLIDADFNILFANTAMGDLFGKPPGEFVGRKCFQEYEKRQEICEHCPGVKAMETGKPALAETSGVRDDGSMFAVRNQAFPLFDSDGSATGFIEVAEDFSKIKQAEQEREKLMKALEVRNRELQSVVYVASHDLRTPLVNIKGFSGELEDYCKRLSELAKTSKPDEKTQREITSLLDNDIPESLGFIATGTDKINTLITGLLQVSRLGTALFNIGPLNMNQIVQQIVESCSYQARQCGATVTADDLPNCLGDTHRTNQVFSNLLDNALKYLNASRPGLIHISGWTEGKSSIYCVQDNGIGVDPLHQAKVFEIFHQLNPQSPISGEGLGLAIVTRILDRQNGQIWLESEMGSGCKFYVSLPTAP